MNSPGTTRVALVTGASRGVGKNVALALAKQGYVVAVAAKSIESSAKLPGSIHETVSEITALGGQALAVQLDVRNESQAEAAVAQVVDRFGRLDVLINNAGALYWRRMVDTPPKSFDLVMNVNARGAYACTYYALPHMIRQGFGHIIMMSPPVSTQGIEGKIAYCISKYGMTMIVHGLCDEVREQNVAVNALWPATMIESYATINWSMGDAKLWRKADILSDATLRIVAKEPRLFSGHTLIDEDFLRSEGVTDFSEYQCVPGHEPPHFSLDFAFTAGGVKTK